MFSRHSAQELLHDQLMEKKKKAQPPPRLPDSDEGSRMDIACRVNGATFRLQAKLASNRVVKTEPLTDIYIKVSRKATKVVILDAAASPNYHKELLSCYILPAFLVKEPPPPLFTNFPLRASLLCSPSTAPADNISWIPNDIRIEQGQRDYLVSRMLRFLRDMVTIWKEEGFEFLTIHLSVTIEHNLMYEGEAQPASAIYVSTDNIENEVRVERKNKEKDLPVECAVCFEEVKQLHDHDFCCSWSTSQSGVQLCCSHVFHLSCIAPWLTTNNSSCPMCRRAQHRFGLFVCK